jgi:hypothetical protein
MERPSNNRNPQDPNAAHKTESETIHRYDPENLQKNER